MKLFKNTLIAFFILLITTSGVFAKVKPGDSYDFNPVYYVTLQPGEEVNFEDIYVITGVKEVTGETFTERSPSGAIEVDYDNRKIKAVKPGNFETVGHISFLYPDGRPSFQEFLFSGKVVGSTSTDKPTAEFKNESNIQLEVPKTYQIILPDLNPKLTNANLSIKSIDYDHNILDVNSSGLITAKKAGVSPVTVNYELKTPNGTVYNYTEKFNVSVSNPKVLPKLTAFAHVEDYGDMNSTTGNRISIGTTGEAKRMEAFTLTTDDPDLGVSYEGHVQDIGWQGAVENGALAGTRGECKRIECFKINLIGKNSSIYDIYYRTHVQEYGWLDWAKNGESAGTSNHCFRCEAMEIAIVPKGSGVPDNGSTYMPAIEAYDREEGDNMFLTNMLRKKEGKPYLTGHPEVHEAAEHRALELYYFSHTRPDGRSCFTMLEDLYPDSDVFACGENIAASSFENDQGLPSDFYHMWDASPGHHANMVNDGFKYMGYAQATNIGGDYRNYGVQFFGV